MWLKIATFMGISEESFRCGRVITVFKNIKIKIKIILNIISYDLTLLFYLNVTCIAIWTYCHIWHEPFDIMYIRVFLFVCHRTKSSIPSNGLVCLAMV